MKYKEKGSDGAAVVKAFTTRKGQAIQAVVNRASDSSIPSFLKGWKIDGRLIREQSIPSSLRRNWSKKMVEKLKVTHLDVLCTVHSFYFKSYVSEICPT